jgi:hypothetical protein
VRQGGGALQRRAEALAARLVRGLSFYAVAGLEETLDAVDEELALAESLLESSLRPFDAFSWTRAPRAHVTGCYLSGAPFEVCAYEHVCVDVPGAGSAENEPPRPGSAASLRAGLHDLLFLEGDEPRGDEAVGEEAVDDKQEGEGEASAGAKSASPLKQRGRSPSRSAARRAAVDAPESPLSKEGLARYFQRELHWRNRRGSRVFPQDIPVRDALYSDGSAAPTPDPFYSDFPAAAFAAAVDAAEVGMDFSATRGPGGDKAPPVNALLPGDVPRVVPYGSRTRLRFAGALEALPAEYGGTSPHPVLWVDGLWIVDPALGAEARRAGAAAYVYNVLVADFHTKASGFDLPPPAWLYLVRDPADLAEAAEDRAAPQLRSLGEESPFTPSAVGESVWVQALTGFLAAEEAAHGGDRRAAAIKRVCTT